MLKIRLKRMGAPKKPKYRLVVAEARSPRDGRSLDILGHFDPMTDPETIVIDAERAQGWLQKGAQPTDTAARLLKKAGVTK
jgi:small subunit ribosomal protein S16